MLNNRRTEIEIFDDILNIAKSDAKKTRILYQANLNYAQLGNYLDFLLDKGLLEEKNIPKRRYKTTERGLEFLKMSEKIQNFLVNPSKVREEIGDVSKEDILDHANTQKSYDEEIPDPDGYSKKIDEFEKNLKRYRRT